MKRSRSVRWVAASVALVAGLTALGPTPSVHAGQASPPRTPSAVAAAETTVMTWNIAGGAIDAGADKWAEHINVLLADVVGLQEVCQHQVYDIETNLEEVTGVSWESRFGVAQNFAASCIGPYGQAFMIKSSAQPRDWLNHPYPHEEAGCGQDPEERAAQSVTVTLGGVDVRVFNTHMATEGRAWCQVPVLIRLASHWPNSIVMGDFNLRPTDTPMQQFTTAGFRNMHPNSYLTVSNDPEDCNKKPTIKFDYILVRGSVRKSFDLFPMCNDASDHRALIAGVLTP
ncbi:endonuclease/exonuclease/phosphatase family protein [Micromonospora sp. NPDC005171]|uniref:endonuclease/exonuclease/phosphatase family protein n=1 Tax=Micromonospora sp. NPDC005171 TaxID=3156866 RepID=UPI0033A28E94